ncbi:MAG: tRNA 2-selenouridine(34) synthase MnmH, partial [Tannerellaceae bacterium]
MEQQELAPDDFLHQSRNGVILDVRTPDEYNVGHIPNAINFPLFTNEERIVVGTAYVKQGRDIAVEKGLELVGPKMATFVRQAKALAAGRTLYIHCWRGGMRSGSMAWLLRTAGLSVQLLQGGYKAYRQSFTDQLNNIPWKLIVLGGSTGCGKTPILHALEAKGEQVLHLEGLACHKGSAFGALGEGEQPTTEQFSNLLYDEFCRFDPRRRVWCE